MTFCKYCGLTKTDDEFQVACVINGKIYKRKKCTSCKIKMQEERRLKIKLEIDTYKSSLTCSKCGFDDYRAIVFHHVDPSTKDISISEALRNGWSVSRIEKEILKCIPLCANCHSILHFDARNL